MSHHNDYLRSVGVLVNFANYKVDQIIEMGWAVIK